MFRHTFDNGETVIITQDETSGSFLLPGYCDHVIKDALQLRDNVEKGYPCHICNTDTKTKTNSNSEFNPNPKYDFNPKPEIKSDPDPNSEEESSPTPFSHTTSTPMNKFSRLTSAKFPKEISSNIDKEEVLRMPKVFDPPMVSRNTGRYVNGLLRRVMDLSKQANYHGKSHEFGWIDTQKRGFNAPGIDIGILEIFRDKDYSQQRRYFINYDFSGGKSEDVRRSTLHLGK